MRGTGGIFESHPVEGQALNFKGSVVVYTGENSEEVHDIIKSDIYATSGVWDLEKVQIIPVSVVSRSSQRQCVNDILPVAN